jgi:hypothetical protein
MGSLTGHALTESISNICWDAVSGLEKIMDSVRNADAWRVWK